MEGRDGAKEVGAFYGCPGLSTSVATLGYGPIRGGALLGSYIYVVSGNTLYRLGTDMIPAVLGALTTSTGPVSVITNTTQILVSDGITGVMWDTNSSTFSTVSTFPAGSYILGYQDTFGIANVPGTQKWYMSNSNDLGTWDALNFSSADSEPTDVISLFDLRREAWIFKGNSIEVWINAGLPGFAFQRLSGVSPQQGCIAAFSPSLIGDSVMWLGQDSLGAGVVYQSRGYAAVRRSTHAVERQWKSYSTMTDAFSYSYQDEGHEFYVLTFPTGDATWVFDNTTGLWHERGQFDSNGNLHRHRSNFHVYFNGNHVVGDFITGDLYNMNLDTFTDIGQPKKWLRSWRALPAGKQQYEPMTFDKLQIDMQKGVTVPDGADPTMALRWSNDGGHTWSNEMIAKVGASGKTAGTVNFRRLGSTSQSKGLDRVFEISSSDAYQVALMAADMDAALS